MARRAEDLNQQIVGCEKCPRLRTHCLDIAEKKRAAFRDQTYSGLPVPNFGDPAARALIVGLAPAAHGANRTGRMFTGDRSGDWLYRAMHRAGLCNQAEAVSADDGLKLNGVMITAAAHCAPPGNKPSTEELAHCAPWLEQTFDLVSDLRVAVCLGRLGFDAVIKLYRERGWAHEKRSHYLFAHGEEFWFEQGAAVVCSYHPSQQNTFTGRLTEPMLDAVFGRVAELIRD